MDSERKPFVTNLRTKVPDVIKIASYGHLEHLKSNPLFVQTHGDGTLLCIINVDCPLIPLMFRVMYFKQSF